MTVMFCDLAGSTELSVRLDPEETREIITAYQRACSAVIGAYGGFISRFLGDGILVYFGYPNAREGTGERAVRAGLEVASTVAQLGRAFDMDLKVRVGIATGLVIVGDVVGDGSAREHAAVGQTPNLAARLQAIAEPGAVLISESTRELVGRVFNITDLGRHSLKGFTRPTRVWQVRGLAPPRDRFDAMTRRRARPLIGRVVESAVMHKLQQAAWGGKGRVALVSGEAGIGKSHLTNWIAEQVSHTRFAHLRYQCSPYHQASALHPFVAQLKQAAGIRPEHDDAHRLSRLSALLARTAREPPDKQLPLLAELLSIPCEPIPPLFKLSSEQKRQLTMTALLDQLFALSAKRPVLATFEDLQWADPTSLELLDAAISRIADARVLIVLTFRPTYDPTRWTVAEWVTRIELGRLGPQDAHSMVAAIAEPRRLPDPVVERIIERSDGVPLFIEELTRTVCRSIARVAHPSIAPAQSDSTLTIPESLRDALLERLDRLTTGKEVAQVAAAIGRTFSYKLVRSAWGENEVSLQAALLQLQDAGIVEVDDSDVEKLYRFKHALLQEAAYDILLKRQRIIIHRRIAQTLANEFEAESFKEPEVIAHHCTFAGMNDEAIVWWRTAGDRAIKRSAYAEAALNLNKAITLADNLPAGAEQRRTQLKLLVAYGQVMIALRGYAAPEATAAFKKARVLVGAIEDAAERYSVYHGLWASSHIRGELTLMRELSDAFLIEVSAQDGIVEAGIARRLVGTTCVFAGEYAKAEPLLESALSAYDPGRDQPLALRFGHDIGVAAECYLALALWPLGKIDRACELISRALVHATVCAHPPTIAYAHAYRCIFEAMRWNAVQALESAQALVMLSQEHSMHWWLASGIFFRGWTHWHAGNRQEGLVDMRLGMDLCSQHGLSAPPALFEVLMAEAEEVEDPGTALARLDQVLKRYASSGEVWFEAEVHRFRGRLLSRMFPNNPSGAVGALRQAAEVARGQGAVTFELRALLDLVNSAGNCGDDVWARVLRLTELLGNQQNLSDLRIEMGLSVPASPSFNVVQLSDARLSKMPRA